MTLSKYTFNYFLFLFSLIPITFLIGSAVLLYNIILLDLSFLILIIYKKDYFFLKSKPIKYLLILYAYLIFNSFISIDYLFSYSRNIGFIRFIILFAAFNYFFLNKSFYKKVISIWLIVILIVSIDVLFEQFTGANIFGFSYGDRFNDDNQILFGRVVSFFKDEPIVGGYLLGFYLILAGFLFDDLKNKKQLFSFAFLILILFTVIFTGERSNSLRAFLGFGAFILFFSKFNFKIKIISLLAVITLIFFLVTNNKYLKIRFVSQIKSMGSIHKVYFKSYNSAFQVFDNHKIFGVGNKNYRVETCRKSNYLNKDNKEKYKCQNHPHQIYLELLSEHGIFGSFLIMFILFKLIFSKIIETFKKDNFLKSGSLIYLLLMFTPLLPTGAFFGNFLLTIFMINLSIFYASDKDYNIFMKKNYG
tara:strand:+ start:2559 stop:3812 length:1254 start_codon:yes stop_codon:yes gene_type:complete